MKEKSKAIPDYYGPGKASRSLRGDSYRPRDNRGCTYR